MHTLFIRPAFDNSASALAFSFDIFEPLLNANKESREAVTANA